MSNDDKKRLGDILVRQQKISRDDLEAALRVREPRPIASQLTQSGQLAEIDALRALSEQFGVPGIDLGQIAIVLADLDVVPREICETHLVLPILVRGDRIFLAMANPKDKQILDEIGFATGRRVYPYVALTTTLERTLAAAFDARARGEAHYVAPRTPPETLEQLGIGLTPVRPSRRPSFTDADEAATRRLSSMAPAGPSMPPMGSSMPPGGGGHPSSRHRIQVPPPPALIVDETTEGASHDFELETNELGNMDADISSVQNLSPEVRNRFFWTKENKPRHDYHFSTSAPPPPDATAKRILVVDDDEEIRKLLARLLTGKGYEVMEADRGLLALRLVRDAQPDLILLDAMLPELHGFDIARRIKGSDKYGSIPIVMMSAVYRGWRIAEDVKANYGVDRFFEKPFKIQEVLGAVTALLEARTELEGDSFDVEAMSTAAERALDQGVAAYRAGDLDRALVELRRGVKIDPLAFRLRYQLALLYGKKGHVYDAITELERAVDMQPKHFPALKNLAVLYEKAGFRHRAVEMWGRAAHVAPDPGTRVTIQEHLRRLV